MRTRIRPSVATAAATAILAALVGLVPPAEAEPRQARTPGVTELVSRALDGHSSGNANSYGANISDRGRYVVFVSAASNLYGGNLAYDDLFRYDRLTGGVRLVTEDDDGSPTSGAGIYSPSISDDGRYVAFATGEPGLVDGDTNDDIDIFVRDMLLEENELVSVDSEGGPTDGNSFQPEISADGRYVVYKSAASDLVEGEQNPFDDIFVFDRETDETTLVSVDTAGGPANWLSEHPSISADGRYVAFESFAGDLVVGPGNLTNDVFVRDLITDTTTLVSVDRTGGAADGPASRPDISADGRYIAFLSEASDLTPEGSGAGPGAVEAYVRDRTLGTTTLVSRSTDGDLSGGPISTVSLSPDGHFAAMMTSNDTMVTCGEPFPGTQSVVRDLTTGSGAYAAVDLDGTPREGNYPRIADGGIVAFESAADDLVPDHTGTIIDVFARHMDLPPTPLFSDVLGTHPFRCDIGWLVDQGIAAGYSDGTFRPASSITRQAMAAFVYRYAGEPAFTPPATATFSDVSPSHPFFAEIEWLADTGVSAGFSDGTYRPGASITRQSAAAFLYRYAGEPAFTPPTTPTFPDVPTTHAFFLEIEWAADEGIVTGFDDETFRPTSAVSRQAIAAFLHRYDENVA